MAKTSFARIQDMNVTEWKHRTKWLCTWKVHLFFENNPLNTTVHNMFPCQVGSSLIWLVHSLIAGDFFANNNVSPNCGPWAQSGWTFNPNFRLLWAMGHRFPILHTLGCLATRRYGIAPQSFSSAEPQVSNIQSRKSHGKAMANALPW